MLAVDAVWLELGAALAFLGWVAWTHRRFSRLRREVLQAWRPIPPLLQQRHDLIPDLAEAVAAHAGDEASPVLDRLAAARTHAERKSGPADAQAEAQRPLVAALREVLARADEHPATPTDPRYAEPRAGLAALERELAAARDRYNAAAAAYMRARGAFPARIVARLTRLPPARPFDVDGALVREPR